MRTCESMDAPEERGQGAPESNSARAGRVGAESVREGRGKGADRGGKSAGRGASFSRCSKKSWILDTNLCFSTLTCVSRHYRVFLDTISLASRDFPALIPGGA